MKVFGFEYKLYNELKILAKKEKEDLTQEKKSFLFTLVVIYWI